MFVPSKFSLEGAPQHSTHHIVHRQNIDGTSPKQGKIKNKLNSYETVERVGGGLTVSARLAVVQFTPMRVWLAIENLERAWIYDFERKHAPPSTGDM
jgi:hypothetical protein